MRKMPFYLSYVFYKCFGLNTVLFYITSQNTPLYPTLCFSFPPLFPVSKSGVLGVPLRAMDHFSFPGRDIRFSAKRSVSETFRHYYYIAQNIYVCFCLFLLLSQNI